MDQELAEPKSTKRLQNPNTQTCKIQEMWKKLPKTEWNKETDLDRKRILKGKLYDKMSEIYEKQEGIKIKRATIRRCVNSLTNKAK